MNCASGLLGIPYLEGGRDPNEGLDCLGLVLLVLASQGIPTSDPGQELKDAWRNGWRDIKAFAPPGWLNLGPAEACTAGDVLVLGAGGTAEHLAVAEDADWALHTRRGTTSHRVRIQAVRPRVLWIWRRPS